MVGASPPASAPVMDSSALFDTPPDRRQSDSVKWGRYAGRDVLPMWVADMDFAAPAAVIEALRTRIDHSVFGYSMPMHSLAAAVVEGLARDHAWHIEADWIVWLPGVVGGFNVACSLAGEPGDEVLTLTPVYPPFLAAPAHAGRQLVRSDLVLRGDRWECDWDDLAARITPRSRMLLLCHPHNPVGRVYGREELTRFAALAEQHGLLLCSDEIHGGLVIDPAHRHLPLAALSPEVARRTITLMAPSKTWNIPGLSSAFAVISDPLLRRRFRQAMRGFVAETNVLGLVATEAAYRHGDAWRQALLGYLHDNARLLVSRINATGILRTTPVEATYLAWIDCRALRLDNPAAFFEQHGVGLSNGADFGMPGFVRLNFGCSRALLEQALARIDKALARPS